MTDRETKNAEKIAEIRELEVAAEEGHAMAQNFLAATLAQGYFVEKDEPGAFYWYCQAIKQGYVDSKYNAGTMLLHGDGGIPVDPILGMLYQSALINTHGPIAVDRWT